MANHYSLHHLGSTRLLLQSPLLDTYCSYTIPYINPDGKAWVLELMNGHPERMRVSLGVSIEAFGLLVDMLSQHCGITPSSKGIFVEEQLAIFLYTAVTGLASRQVGERFQHSNETIVK